MFNFGTAQRYMLLAMDINCNVFSSYDHPFNIISYPLFVFT